MRTELHDNTKQFIVEMPKVELHVHLEGAIPLRTLFQLIQRKGTEPSIRTLDDLHSKFIPTDFTRFAELWGWKRTFITAEEDFEEMAYQLLYDLYQQNVKYVEVIFAPGDCWREGLSIQGVTEYVIKGKERAHIDFGIQSELIVDLVRDRGPERGIQILEETTPYLGHGLTGITLGGTEHRFPAKPYVPVFKEAKERGFRLTAHAGETVGASSIWVAIDELHAERIGHGIRANEDQKLFSLLKEKQIPLEMCVTSNVKIGVCKSAVEHPIKDYFEQGLMVTVNSDDPTMFNTSITQEYEVLVRELGFSIDELKRLSMNSIDASFMSDGDKESMKSQFEREW